jgi:transposase
MSETQRIINNLRGKYIKQVLSRIEQEEMLTAEIRKIVLDEINDLVREILKELGYTYDR